MLAKPLARFLAARGIHYGWAMAALTFFTMLATAAGMGMPGVLIIPLEKQFGWDAATVSGPLAMRLLLFGLMAPFSAALLTRFGIKRTILFALALIVGGLIAARMVTNIWQLWAAWGLALGVGSGIGGVVFGTTVATRWFTRHRGLIIGLLTASNATGQLIFLPLAARLADDYGWQAALTPATIACAVMAVVLLLFAVERPADLGLPLYGENTVAVTPAVPLGNFVSVAFGNLGSASKVPIFWLLAGSFFVCGMSTNGLVQTHFIPLCHDFGMTAVAGATVLTMMGACDFVGTIGSGWLSDRVNPRTLLIFYYGLRGISLLVLPFLPFSVVGLSLFAVFYGLDWIATAPATVRLAADAFGRERAPMIFGWVFAAHQIGSASVAFGAGVSRDILQTYVPAFESAGLACIAVALAFVIVRASARRPAVVVAAE